MNPIDQNAPFSAATRKRPAIRMRALARLALGAAALFAGAAHAAQGDNLALGKPVTMSGTTGDPTQAGANCTDGDRNGNYPADAVCMTSATQTGANREWIEVDLGQDYIIDRVRLSNRTDGTNGDRSRWLAVTTRPSSLTGVTSDPLSTLNSALNPNAPFVNKIAYGAGTSTAGGIYGTGQGDPWTTLDMKVGTHVARYVRIYTMKANTALNLAEIEVFEGPPPSRSIVNQSFEQPGINAGGNAQIAETVVPGWSTTEPVAVPNLGFGTAFLTGGNIEMWNTGFGGVTADAGSQFVELNAFNNGTLSPAPLCVYPGETFNWRVSHRARGAAGVTDVARLRINGQDIATFRDGVTQGGEHTCTPEAGFNCTAQAGSPTATGWGRWQGSWTNTQTQPKAMTFEFAAISSSGGPGFGNFIDNVSIAGLTAAVEFSTSAASGPESVATANLPVLLVNGPVTTAQTIELEVVGGSATRGGDYTTNPASGPILVTIPAGNYDGTAATAISLAPYLQIVADIAVEGAETIALRLTHASAGLSIAGASGCRAGVADSTYTITDEAVPTIGKRFAPETIPYGGSTTLTFTIDNSGADSVDRPIAFTDNLAAGLRIADPANAASTCGGSVAAAPGGDQIVFSGGSVPAGGFCTVSVDITNRPGFSGLCYNPNFANENQNLVGLQNLIAQIEQYTCVSVTPPDCPDSAVTNGFGNISGLSPNLNNGINGQCVAVMPTLRLVKISNYAVGSFGFTLGNTSATNPVTIATTAPGAPGTSSAVFDVLDLAQPLTVAESVLPPNWVLSDIACRHADGTPIGAFDSASGTWSAAPGDLAYGQQITCTATNTADRLDFGDAPDSYGTLSSSNGPRHALGAYDEAAGTAPLMLGARVDHENDGVAGTAADGDDGNGIDDEDAFFGSIALQPGTTAVSLDVPVTNTTGGSAHLYAWIDFNGNGRFDAAEAGACPAVAAAATQVTCTWTAPAPLTDGFLTYARFRLTTQALAAGTAPNGGDARAQGLAADGEVEDHRVSVATVLPLTCEAPFVETFGNYTSAPGAFPGWGRPLPAGTTTYVFQPGSATPANTVNGGQYALMTRPNLSHSPAWQNAPDHTPGDTDGFMMVVNASPAPGVFYRRTFSGLTIGARYNFFSSLANVVAGLNAGLPNVTLRIVDPATNAVLASLDTGDIPEDPAGAMTWHAHQLIFIATQADVRVELANNSGVQGGNDLALDDIGFAQVCELGDAPDSYATLNASNGAGHLFPGPGLSLGGGLPDGEMDGQPGPNADGDDLAGSDDENAFPGGAPALVIGAPYSLSVPVETTAGAATACAWADLDQNGSFSAAEGQCQPLVAGATTAGFTWPAAATAGLASGQTYLRLRIERAGTFPTDMSTADFAGVRGPGEVEDYLVAVLTPANVTLVKALTGESGSLAGAAEPGEQLTYTITLTNTGGTPATNYGVTDALDPNVTFVSASNGGVAAGGAVTWAGLTVPANGTLALTVVVQVVDPIPAGTTQIGNVAYETGTTPPACPPAGGQCVVLPTAPKVTVAKALTGESGTLAGQAEAGEQLTYTITLTNTGGTAATNYGVTDTLDPNVTFVSASNGGTATGGAVNWTGLTVPANGGLTLTIVVRVADPIPAGVLQIGNVAYETGTTPPPCPPAGGQCVVVPTAPKITIGKTASTPAPAGAPNQYSITYVVAVRNDGGSAGTYDLADTLTFNGATVTAISTPAHASGSGDPQSGTPGAFTAPGGGTIVTGEGLAPRNEETWTYTVTYTVTDADIAADCADPAGGLRNHALLGGASAGAPAADTCSGAPSVAIVKTAAAPVPTGTPNQFTMTYTVNVTNGGTLPGVYDLADTLTFNGATVNAITVPTYASSTGDVQDGTLGTFAAPTGGTIVTGENVAAGGTETWTYTVTYTVTDPATAQDCADPNGGLRNLAELGGSLSGQSTTCTGAPAVNVGKSAGGPVPTGNAGEYALDYLVSVQNNGTLPGTYNLADTFTFAGVTVVSVSPVTHAGSDPLAATLGTLTATGGTIVAGETIAAGASETYAYRVVFTLEDVAAVGTCAAGGGLKNQAALGGSSSGQVGTCSDVPDIAVSKAVGAPAPTGTLNQYTMTYTITVDNAGAAAGSYDLSDAFAFAGATVDAVSVVTHGGSDPLATALGTLTPAGGTIVAGETIAALAEETYTYAVTFTITDPAAAADCANPAGGLRNAAVLGGSAIGDAETCTGAPNVAIAKALTAESGALAGQAEPGEQLTYTITLTNSGGSAATNYGVTDTLDPNVTFVSASNGGTAAAGAVTWSGLTVPANGTLTLTAVVQVIDPIPAGTTQIGNVAYETGTTPPTCPPAGGQCVIVPTAPKLALAKSAGAPTPTGAPNQYAITYVVTVRNDGGSVGSYDLADTLTFNGATVTAVSAPVYAGSGGEVQDGVLGGIGAPNGGSIVGSERIGALGTESWTYTVTYAIDDADLAADCAAPNGGLRNQAALGGAATGTPPAATCTGAPSVGIVKTVSTPVPTGNPNQFTLTYVVDVANTGTLPGRYDLADALSFNGATVDAISVPAYGSGSGDTQDGTPGAFAAPDGGTIVTGEAISAGGMESWTYLVTYTVTDPATAQDCASPSGGLRNRARLGGSLAGESTTCTGAPAVVIGKSASGPTPTGNPNEYRLTYLVNVQNDGTLPGSYDLADTFTFAGATVVSVSAVQHGGGDPLATTLGTLSATGGSIVSGESIAAGADENYTYSVILAIDDAAAIGTCANGGGLKNHAALGGSSAGQVETCSDVPDVTVSKAASGPTPTGTPNQYAIVYTVTVDNGGGAAGGYDLADAFAFAGATVDAVSAVTHAGPDPLATTLGTLGANGGSIVTAETIAAGGSESYTYTVTFTLTDADLADDCADPNGGLRNTAALGGSAIGDARTCTGAPLLAIVKTLTGESGGAAGVAEAGEQLTYTITLNNGGSSDAVDQSITDRLDANVTFVSADNGGTLVGGNVQWTGLTVPAGGSLALTVTVRVADPIPDGVSAIGNVAYDPGIGPPDCNATPRPSNCTVTPTPSAVTIVKALAAESGSLTGVAEPGEQLTYTITLSNAGGSDATGYGVTDALDPNTRFVSADNGGVHAGGVVTWSGLSVPANGSLVLTVVVQVADPLPAGVTQVANVAYQTGTTAPACPPADGQCVVTPTAGAVTIVKSVADASGNGLAEPGEQLTYTIALTNTGGNVVTNYAVTDPLDANTRFVSADHGGVHAAGVVNWSGLTIPANGTLNLTLVVQVLDPLPAGVTLIGNVAYQTGTTPPDCNDKGRPPNCVDIEVPPQAGVPRLSITKTASSAVLQPGGAVVYTITVRNVGSADASDVVVSDPIPLGIDAYAWSCAATGLTCPNASGSGAIAEQIASFPVGASVVYTVTATLSADPPATVNNTATVTPGGIATCADGSAPPCPATAIGTVVPPHTPLPVPTVHLWAQLLIALSLFGLAWRKRRS